METTDLLQLAREIIAGVPACMAITVDRDGEANARVVNARPPSEGWTIRFMTDRRSRKCLEIERSGRLTLAYQHDPGNAVINDDVASKTANWRPESYRWHPGGPADPNVVYVDFTTGRIELWSSRHGVVPDPVMGMWAAALVRGTSGWRQLTTLPRPAYAPCPGIGEPCAAIRRASLPTLPKRGNSRINTRTRTDRGQPNHRPLAHGQR